MPLAGSKKAAAPMTRNRRPLRSANVVKMHRLRERMTGLIQLDKLEAESAGTGDLAEQLTTTSALAHEENAVTTASQSAQTSAVDELAERLLFLRIIGEECVVIRQSLQVCTKIASLLGTAIPDGSGALGIRLLP